MCNSQFNTAIRYIRNNRKCLFQACDGRCTIALFHVHKAHVVVKTCNTVIIYIQFIRIYHFDLFIAFFSLVKFSHRTVYRCNVKKRCSLLNRTGQLHLFNQGVYIRNNNKRLFILCSHSIITDLFIMQSPVLRKIPRVHIVPPEMPLHPPYVLCYIGYLIDLISHYNPRFSPPTTLYEKVVKSAIERTLHCLNTF